MGRDHEQGRGLCSRLLSMPGSCEPGPGRHSEQLVTSQAGQQRSAQGDVGGQCAGR